MGVFTILQKNMKWRYHNSFTIVITILQPILWLILYSTVARQAMQGTGIQNYTAFILPGLIILVSFSTCSSSGIMNYMMKTEGSFYRVLIAPIKRSTNNLYPQSSHKVNNLCSYPMDTTNRGSSETPPQVMIEVAL